MASTRSALRTKVLANMDGRSDTAVTTAIDLGLDEACKVIMGAGGTGHRWRGLGTRVSNLSTSATLQTVALPTGCGVIKELMLLDSTSSYRIEVRDAGWVEQWLTAADQQSKSKPVWAYREGGNLYLAPSPDAAYTLRLRYELTLAFGATEINADGFDEALVAYATSHAWGSVQHGANQAKYWLDKFGTILSAMIATERKDQPRRGVNTRCSRRGDPTVWPDDPRVFTLPEGHS